MNKKWIACFSQTGSEIVNLSKGLRRWPDTIVTNERPENLRIINPELKDRVVFVENKPTEEELRLIFSQYNDPLITLHGWLRIMPPDICREYTIVNGHPGLITEYEFLKGKDPQIRAFEMKLPVMGCVLHRVTEGVDEGKVISQERFNAFNITEQEMWETTRDRSESLWRNFLEKTVL